MKKNMITMKRLGQAECVKPSLFVNTEKSAAVELESPGERTLFRAAIKAQVKGPVWLFRIA